MNLQKMLQKRRTALERLIQNKQKELQKLPRGKVRTTTSHRSIQYRFREEGASKDVYVRKKDVPQIAKVVQREYDETVIKKAETELEIINKLYSFREDKRPEDIVSMMPSGKQKLITPILQSEEDFIRQWKSIQFTPLEFSEHSAEYYSIKEERMRSKSEVIIANLMTKLGIEYIYEMPLTFEEGYSIRPDFTILDSANRRVIYYEHFGMMDDEVYLVKALKKLNLYQEHGYFLGESLIISAESSRQRIDVKAIEQMLRHYILKTT